MTQTDTLTLKDHQLKCVKMTLRLESMKEKGLGETPEYCTVRSHRSVARNAYQMAYLEKLKEEYQLSDIRNEIIKRYASSQVLVSEMPDGYDKKMLEEEIWLLKKLQNDYTEPDSFKPKFTFNAVRKDGKRISINDIEFELEAFGQIIKKLTPAQQELVEMVWIQGKSVVEAANILGVNKSTVTRTLQRALAHVTRELSRDIQVHHRENSANIIDLSDKRIWTEIRYRLFNDYHMLLIVLYFNDHMSVETISNMLQLNKSTISRTLKRCICKLMNYTRQDNVVIDHFEIMVNYVEEMWTKIMKKYDFFEYCEKHSNDSTERINRYKKKYTHTNLGRLDNLLYVNYGLPRGTTSVSKEISKYASTHKRT